MNEDLQNEVEAINSIYGDGSLSETEEKGIYVLHLPQHTVSLRCFLPDDYPSTPPTVLGTQSSGEHGRRGEGASIVEVFRNVLGRLFQPGQVCLFDVIEEVNTTQPSSNQDFEERASTPSDFNGGSQGMLSKSEELQIQETPPWTLSEVVVELKSVFIARCAPVLSPDQAKTFLQHLLDSDKKVRSATHNITAWRIKGTNGITYQDCDDDGETAAGGRVLHLMQLMDIWNAMVVVTRWYGGHQLGPKRFSIINTVARDSFVKAGFVKEEAPTKKAKR